MPSPRPATCAGAACVQQACIIIARPDSQFLCTHVYFFFVITHRSTVLSILISNLIHKYNSLTLAPNMPCMLLVFTGASDLNVNFRLSVCHGWTVNFFARFASCFNSNIMQELKTRTMPCGQSNSSMATTRTETTHGLTYSMT